MTASRRIPRLTATAAMVWLAATSAAGQQASVAGRWLFSVTTSAGTGMPTVAFTQNGEAITGHYSSETLGEADFKGTVKGNAIRFTFNTSVQGQQVDVVYEGTVEQDTMKGSMAIAAGQVTGTFTGRKQ